MVSFVALELLGYGETEFSYQYYLARFLFLIDILGFGLLFLEETQVSNYNITDSKISITRFNKAPSSNSSPFFVACVRFM